MDYFALAKQLTAQYPTCEACQDDISTDREILGARVCEACFQSIMEDQGDISRPA